MESTFFKSCHGQEFADHLREVTFSKSCHGQEFADHLRKVTFTKSCLWFVLLPLGFLQGQRQTL